MAYLELQSIELEIGQKLICKDFSLRIEENERWGLLGRNGVGKTT